MCKKQGAGRGEGRERFVCFAVGRSRQFLAYIWRYLIDRPPFCHEIRSAGWHLVNTHERRWWDMIGRTTFVMIFGWSADFLSMRISEHARRFQIHHITRNMPILIMQIIRLPPATMNELYHTDHTDHTDHRNQEYIFPERSRSRTVVQIDHTYHPCEGWRAQEWSTALFLR